MSLHCGCDEDFYFEIGRYFVTSCGTEECTECRKLIHAGVEHCLGFSYKHDEFMEECHIAKQPFCEECADLILSFMELGYCWTRGDTRSDIAEMNAEYGIGS